jgi:hypothetical protein
MDALAKGFRVLDFSGLDDEPPARVQSVENDDHLSMVFLPFKGGDLQPLELVPDLSAGTAGSAIPVSTPPPQRRGSKFVCGGYEVPSGHEEELLPALRSLRRPKGAGTRLHAARARARASRGRSVRVRGSRRSTAAAHSSSSDDPGLADEPPEHLAAVA